jgi:hypothetical protein
MKKLFLLLLLYPFVAFSQPESYPKNYFRNPLGIPILLAGNFGECRPNHFHSGIDIKTMGRENFPVFAAADGYISRIKMEKGGFGHALYVTHPNGFTTLYAHLNDFIPAVQRYTKRMQYEKESWAVDLQLNADQFPVNRRIYSAALAFRDQGYKNGAPAQPDAVRFPDYGHAFARPNAVVFLRHEREHLQPECKGH